MLFSNVNSTNVTQVQQSERKMKLVAGQIFRGQIVKMFPNHTVALQVGAMTLTARLEAPLTAGQTYWFEVQHGTGIPRLKVLDDNFVRQQAHTTQADSLRSVLQQLGIQQTKEHEQLLRFFSEQQLPFSKESIQRGAYVLQQAGAFNRQGFETLQLLIERNIPLTLATFQAIQSAQANVSTIDSLNELSSLLSQSKANEQFVHIEAQLRSFLQSIRLPAESNEFGQLLQLIGKEDSSNEMKHSALLLLQRAGLLREGMTLEQFFSEFKRAVLDPKNSEIVRMLWGFSQQSEQGGLNLQLIDSRTLYQLLISRLHLNDEQVGRHFFRLFSQDASLTERQIKQLVANLSSQLQQMNEQERVVYGQLVASAYGNSKQTGTTIQTLFTHIATMLGYGQENEVIRFLQGEHSLKESLQMDKVKSLLLRLTNENIPTSIRDKAEFLLQRLTGQQLLATDHFGPIQQLAIQIPLNLDGFLTDLTIQWEGKKLKNGQINPEHCRILFYLQLETLQETIVDVQIQKRYVTIQVFNERTAPQQMLDELVPILKEKLAMLDYQLSAVTWRNITETKAKKTKLTPNLQGYERPSMYQGVDVRI